MTNPNMVCLASLGLTLEDIYCGNNLIVVHEDGEVDGSWVLQALLAEFNRGIVTGSKWNSTGLTVLNHQAEGHWSSIAGKLGWNWAKMKEKGQLAVIDLLESTYKYYAGEHMDINAGSKIQDIATPEVDLTDLLAKCVAEIDNLTKNTPESNNENECLFIIVENLSHLFNCSGESEIDILNFLQQLRFYRNRSNVCVCVLVSNDGSESYFTKTLSNLLANCTFKVKPLQTGYSPQIDGTVCLTKYQRKIPFEKVNHFFGKAFHFKLEDRNVKVTPFS